MEKRIHIIILFILLFASISILIGLLVTGYMIGWGPFAVLRYYNSVTYPISENEYSFTSEKKLLRVKMEILLVICIFRRMVRIKKN